MGRGKIEIKMIENTTNRQVTFSKRRGGLDKKARQLSILCDAEVALVVFPSTRKLHQWSSSSMKKVLERYQKSDQGVGLMDHQQELLCEMRQITKENETLQAHLRHMKGQDINSLKIPQLFHLEQQLEQATTNVRKRKDQVLDNEKTKTRNKLRRVEEENILLQAMVNEHHGLMEEDHGEINFLFCQPLKRLRNPFPAPSPSPSFRLHPNQPNLQNSGIYQH